MASIDLSNNNLQAVDVNYNDTLFANLKILENKKEVVVENIDAYIDIVGLLPLIENTKSLIESKTLYLDLNANYGDIILTGGLNIVDGNISLSVVISAYGFNINLALLNETIYLSYDNLKLKFALNEIDSLLSFLNDNFGIDLNSKLDEIQNLEIDIDKITENIKSEDFQEILAKLKLSLTNDNLIASYDKLGVEINFANSQINFIKASYSDLEAKISIVSEACTVNVEDESNYINIIDLLPLVQNIIQYVNDNNFYLDFVAIYNDYRIEGALNIADGAITLALNTTIYGQKINLVLIDNILYLDVNNIKGKFAIEDIDEVAYLLNNNFGIDVVEILEKIASLDLNNIRLDNIISIFDGVNLDINLDIESLISSLELSLSLNMLTASVDA